MDKQHHLINFSLIDHVPKIFNMMHILNLMIFGIVVSQPVFFLMGIASIQQSIRLSPGKLLTRLRNSKLWKNKILNYIIASIIVFLFLFLNRSSGSILLIAFVFTLLIFINHLLTIRKTDLPVNQMMHFWK